MRGHIKKRVELRKKKRFRREKYSIGKKILRFKFTRQRRGFLNSIKLRNSRGLLIGCKVRRIRKNNFLRRVILLYGKTLLRVWGFKWESILAGLNTYFISKLRRSIKRARVKRTMFKRTGRKYLIMSIHRKARLIRSRLKSIRRHYLGLTRLITIVESNAIFNELIDNFKNSLDNLSRTIRIFIRRRRVSTWRRRWRFYRRNRHRIMYTSKLSNLLTIYDKSIELTTRELEKTFSDYGYIYGSQKTLRVFRKEKRYRWKRRSRYRTPKGDSFSKRMLKYKTKAISVLSNKWAKITIKKLITRYRISLTYVDAPLTLAPRMFIGFTFRRRLMDPVFFENFGKDFEFIYTHKTYIDKFVLIGDPLTFKTFIRFNRELDKPSGDSISKMLNDFKEIARKKLKYLRTKSDPDYCLYLDFKYRWGSVTPFDFEYSHKSSDITEIFDCFFYYSFSWNLELYKVVSAMIFYSITSNIAKK